MSIELIAEIGSNHNGSYERAVNLTRAAIEAGADTVKFQLFKASQLWRKNDPRYETVIETPEEWLPELKAVCEDAGKNFLCTPFSPDAVEYLARLNVKRLKVASGDLTYIPLLETVGLTGLPVLLSCGYSTDAEVRQAVTVLTKCGTTDLTLMACNGGYPTKPEDANLTRIVNLKTLGMWFKNGKTKINVGLSSHMLEWWVDLIAVVLGASVIEKHFDLVDPCSIEVGRETNHSLDECAFGEFVYAVRNCEAALITHSTFCPDDEYARQNARRDPSDWLRPMR